MKKCEVVRLGALWKIRKFGHSACVLKELVSSEMGFLGQLRCVSGIQGDRWSEEGRSVYTCARLGWGVPVKRC